MAPSGRIDPKFCMHRAFGMLIPKIYRVSHKKCYLVWRAVAPLNFELGIKVGGVLESSGSQL